MLYYIVLRSAWQAGTTLCMATADGREDVPNICTTQKSLGKLVFARVNSQCYIYMSSLLTAFYYSRFAKKK